MTARSEISSVTCPTTPARRRASRCPSGISPPSGPPIQNWPGWSRPLNEGYPIETTKIGLPTLIRSVAGRDVYLHSRYQPIDEARDSSIRSISTPIQCSTCMASRLGYHLEELFDRASSEAIFFVYEPDLRMLRTALEHRDLTRLVQSKRVLFFHKPDKGELFARLMPYMSVLSIGAGTVSHGPSVRLEPSFHEQMGAWLDEFRAFAKTTLTTLVINGQRTSENIARNLAWYCAAPGVSRLKDKYRGKPAVIVSAGPSLRKNKHLLKGLEKSAVMVAVQTTLQPLLEMGVEPHFVTSLDWSDICTRFFEKLPPTIKTELVAEPKATSKIFSMHPGPLSLTGNDFAEGLLREMKLQKGKLNSGATVAHLAYYLAEHLGCDPIIFVGQDLGFSRRALLRAGHQLRRRLAAGVVSILHRRDEAVGADRPRSQYPPPHP